VANTAPWCLIVAKNELLVLPNSVVLNGLGNGARMKMKTGYNNFEEAMISMLTKKQKEKLLDIARNTNIGTEYSEQFGGIALACLAGKIEKSLTGKNGTNWFEVLSENRK